MPLPTGQVITALGPVAPAALGRVMMHEHLHSDIYDWDRGEMVQEERPITEERRALLMREAIPYLRQCKDYGCGAFVEAAMPPWRACLQLFTSVLPAFRELGLTAEEEEQMMATNPQRLLPVQ